MKNVIILMLLLTVLVPSFAYAGIFDDTKAIVHDTAKDAVQEATESVKEDIKKEASGFLEETKQTIKSIIVEIFKLFAMIWILWLLSFIMEPYYRKLAKMLLFITLIADLIQITYNFLN